MLAGPRDCDTLPAVTTVRHAVICICALALATFEGRAQDPSRLIERYRQLLAANPVPGTALDRLWKLYQDTGKTQGLLDEYKAAAHNGDFSAALLYGHFLDKSGESEPAREAFRAAAEIRPDDPRPLLALGRLDLRESKAESAADAFEQALEKLPADSRERVDILIELGNARAAAHQPEKAAEAWERIVEANPQDLAIRRRLIHAYESNNLPDRAVRHYEVIADRGDPYERVTALRNLARIYQTQGKTDQAIAALEKGIQRAAAGNWLREELQGDLIRLHQKTDRIPELEKRWIEGVRRNPRDLAGYLQLISLYQRTGALDQQRTWLERLVELVPQNTEFKLRLAKLLVRLDDIPEASRRYDELLAASPEDADLVFQRAELDVRSGDLLGARTRIERLLARSKEDSLHRRAVEFYQAHHLPDMVEHHLSLAAAGPDAPADAIVALASFQFAQSREEEAAQTLQRLVRASDTPVEQAAAWARIASVFNEQGLRKHTVQALDRAVELQPESLPFQLSLAEALAAAGQKKQALDRIRRAGDLASTSNQKLEVDQKLFQMLQPGGEVTLPGMKPARPMHLTLDPRKVDRMLSPSTTPDGGKDLNEELIMVTDEFAARADHSPTLENLVRAARWDLWRRSYASAQALVTRAITEHPKEVEPRELAVRIFEAANRAPEAIEQLDELAQMNPDNATEYRRAAAHLNGEIGRTDHSLDLLKSLAEDQPGDTAVLSDYALALQQADRWSEALEVWQQAYDRSTGADRNPLVQPMVRAMERLGLHERATTLLLTEMDAETDPAIRSNFLRDLIAYASAHQRTAWLLEELEKRHRSLPDDYFTLSALARLLKEENREEEALDLLEEASYSSPNPVATLEELVKEAEELGRYREAVDAQRRLLWQRPQFELPEAERLAELQETRLDIEGAAGTWSEIASRFSRDPAALNRAADFYIRWQYPEKALNALRTVRALEPGDPASLLRLARLALEEGGIEEALSAFEQILENTAPSRADETLRFPERRAVEAAPLQRSYFQAARLRNAMPNPDTMRAVKDFWSGSPRGLRAPADYRLEAIRGISQLRRQMNDDAALQGWLRYWQRQRDSSPVEALWACYYAGQGDEALEIIKGILSRRPRDSNVKQAALWLALQVGRYDWITADDHDPADRDLFMVALGQELALNRGNTRLAELLFPPSFHSRQVLWQAASLFAGQGRFSEAAWIGERVFRDATLNRAAYGNEVGSWYLYAGNIQAARRIFLDAAHGEGNGFEDTVYEALRRYFLSLPEEERELFAEDFLEQPMESPVHAAIVRTLLYGLLGNSEAAEDALDQLLDLRAVAWAGDFSESAAQRHWRFLLNAGVQLQTWKLNDLAVYLWESALADEAAIRLQGSDIASTVREIRLRLIAAQLVEDSPFEAELRVAEFARTSSPELVLVLASMLENAGYYNQSLRALTYLCRTDPVNPQFLRSLLNSCRGADDAATATQAIEAALKAGLAESAGRRDLVMQFLEFLIGRNELSAALDLIARLEPEDRADPRILEREGRILSLQGRTAEAEQIYRKLLALDESNIAFRFSLAETLDRGGKNSEAIDVLRDASSRTPGVLAEMRLAGLYLKSGDIDRVRTIARRLLRGKAGGEIPSLAGQIASLGDKELALILLHTAISQTDDARLLVDWQIQAIQLIDRAKEPVLFQKSLARLKAFAGDQIDLALRYYDLRQNLLEPRSQSEWTAELEGDWADGEGSAAAGVKLAERYADAGAADSLDRVLGRLFERSDLPAPSLTRVIEHLQKPALFDRAVRVTAHLVELQPMQEEFWLNHARMLVASGNVKAALERLDQLSCRRVLDDSITAPLAEAYVEAGETTKARALFEEAVQEDPAARNFNVYNAYARLLLDEGDLSAAGRILSTGYSNRKNRDVTLLLDYVRASNANLAPERLLAALQIPPATSRKFYVALFRRLESEHAAPAAIDLMARHPEILSDDPTAAERLRDLAESGGRSTQAIEILETRLAQAEVPDAEIARVLARLHERVATRALSDREEEVAFVHFSRAHELLPGDFEIASRLADLLVARGDEAAAAGVWNRVIDSAPDEETRLKARERLALLRRS